MELIAPLFDYAFMRHALAGGVALALASAPLGVFLVLRRMSLTSEGMAHAVLPGVAIGYIVGGFSLTAMAVGGLIAGLTVACLAAAMARLTALREETSLAGLYLIALAAGAVILSVGARPLDLLHVLFGNALALDRPGVLLLAGLAGCVVLALLAFYRVLVIETVDPGFFGVASGLGPWVGAAFLGLVAATLVAGFQAMGTLMGAALMVLPAAGARLWTDRLPTMIALAAGAAVLAVLLGLLAAYHLSWPAGPSVALAAGLFFVGSCLFGAQGGAIGQLRPVRHLEG